VLWVISLAPSGIPTSLFMEVCDSSSAGMSISRLYVRFACVSNYRRRFNVTNRSMSRQSQCMDGLPFA
jgi:hypothetical protein